MLRRGQDRVKRFLPGNLGGGRAILIILVLIIGGWALTGFYRVQPDQVGVVLTFGEYTSTTEPGLHYHLPYPIQDVERPSVTTVNRIDIGFTGDPSAGRVRDIPEESLMLTGDANLIDIDFSVLWRIDRSSQGVRNFLFNIADPEASVKAVAESAMREVIGQTEIQRALTEDRSQIEVTVRERTQAVLNEYGAGVLIDGVVLQAVDPPEPVIDAFLDVERAQQDQDRLRNEAEAYRNDIIPRARGEAEQMIQQAEAYREQVVAEADGDAQRFTSVLESYQIAPAVTAQRLYLETIEEVFSDVGLTIIDSEGTGQGVVPYLPLDQLRGSNAAQGR